MIYSFTLRDVDSANFADKYHLPLSSHEEKCKNTSEVK